MRSVLFRRWLSLSGALALLSIASCAGTSASTLRVALRPIETEHALGPGQGFVLLDMQLSHDVPRLWVAPTSDSGRKFSIEDLPQGNSLKLIAVEAGDYRFRRVEIMGYPRRGKMVPFEVDLNDENPFLEFTVHEGEVNYPGRLIVFRDGFRLMSFTMNRSGQIAEKLLDEADWLLLEHPASYTGRRRDNFLNYYSTRLKRLRAEASAESGGDDAKP
ncbi:MAG: hypothetical protein NXI30_07500 [bacterium]|nr:hypothetical protein [bacterium]